MNLMRSDIQEEESGSNSSEVKPTSQATGGQSDDGEQSEGPTAKKNNTGKKSSKDVNQLNSFIQSKYGRFPKNSGVKNSNKKAKKKKHSPKKQENIEVAKPQINI